MQVFAKKDRIRELPGQIIGITTASVQIQLRQFGDFNHSAAC
jgi:hypothetical protein